MDTPKQGGRVLKGKIFELLKSTDFDLALEELSRLPPRQVINPLFSFLHNSDENIKWAAITAIGAIVAKLADEDMEGARVIIRRLMWNLNDESGGIGWGSPEAMGEILARHEGLAREYVHILLSYTKNGGNYLEHDILQRGLLWGIGRLCQVRPELVKGAASHLTAYLNSKDAAIRGLSAWVMGLLGIEEARSGLDLLTEDEADLPVYIGRRGIKCQVKGLAKEALERLPSQTPD